MLAISIPADYSIMESTEEMSYTELQPAASTDRSCFITPSADPCLPEFLEDLTCVEYIVQTEDTAGPDWQGLFHLPESPESLVRDDSITEDLLQTRLYEESRVYEEDDDASVMLDFMDLTFLDEECETTEETVTEMAEEEGGYGHSFVDTLDAFPTVITTANPSGAIPEFQHFTSSLFRPPTPSPSPPSSPSYTTFTLAPPSSTTATTITNTPLSPTTTTSLPAKSTMTFHYCDHPTTIVTIVNPGVTNANMDYTSADTQFPPSPPDSTDGSTVLVEMVSTQTEYSRKQQMERTEEEKQQIGQWEEMTKRSSRTVITDFDSFDNSDDDCDDEDPDYKPYCDSRKGAKKNLLWKFLLWSLDHHSDVVRWTDVQKGIFKFVDTVQMSTMWGERKKKHDMTFEKLSRGIRHYYKRGLMERLSNTRLMYKFNWQKVPRRYRKA